MRFNRIHFQKRFTPLEGSPDVMSGLPARLRRTGLLTGFTLIEMIVYVGILAMISIFIINSFARIADAYRRARSEREALANARTLLKTIADTSAEARAVYVPTSRFNVNAGQLSLSSSAIATPGHTASYVDFWVDNGRAYMRTESEGGLPISSSGVRVSLFRFEQIAQAPGRNAVKITIRADTTNATYPASVTLTTTAALRGNY